MTNRSTYLRRASTLSLALAAAAAFAACVADPSGAPVDPADDDASPDTLVDARADERADDASIGLPTSATDASADDARATPTDTGGASSAHDASLAEGSPPDAGASDASGHDGSVTDTSVADTSAHDTGAYDTSAHDTGVHDGGVADTSVADTSAHDGGVADTSVADSGAHDAPPDTRSDVGVADAATPDPAGLVWRQANLTWFTSYPDPGSEECVQYNGCTWAGQFAATDGVQPLSWVESHNIAAVHSKDFAKYELKTLRLKQGTKTIDVVVYDECADSDCSGCCTKNAGSLGYLIDLESFTADRFGVHSGVVDWACLDCGSNP